MSLSVMRDIYLHPLPLDHALRRPHQDSHLLWGPCLCSTGGRCPEGFLESGTPGLLHTCDHISELACTKLSLSIPVTVDLQDLIKKGPRAPESVKSWEKEGTRVPWKEELSSNRADLTRNTSDEEWPLCYSRTRLLGSGKARGMVSGFLGGQGIG